VFRRHSHSFINEKFLECRINVIRPPENNLTTKGESDADYGFFIKEGNNRRY